MPDNNKLAMDMMATPSLPGKTIVMPSDYLPKERKRLSSTTILFIVLGVVVLCVVVVLVLFFTRQPSTPSAPLATDLSPVVSEPTPEAPQPTTPTESQPVPSQPTPSANVALPVVVSGSVPGATDTDQDGLSDAEEQLFLTSVSVPDTDQDGFLDGVELRNLYDPATPKALLEVSPQIKIARNDSLGYQLLIPLTWTAAKTTTDGKEFVVRPADGTESFNVTVYDNPDRQNVTEWFQRQQPNANLTQFVNFRNEAGWTGIQTQDHRMIVASLNDGGPGSLAYIFVLYYDAGQEPELRYSAVWDMMANSLSVSQSSTAAVPATTTPVQP